MTYKNFFLAAMLLSLMPVAVGAQDTDINCRDLRGKVVYQDDHVVFRQIDEHTWIGNGHLVYNESLYLVEGNDRVLLIDAGTYIPDLDKIVAKITSKPVTMMLTHAHGDHVGGVGAFPEVYLNAGDMTIVPNNIHNYQGQIKYLNDGEVIDLGGREILDGERQPTVSNGNNGGMDMMVDDKGVRINFSSRSGKK